MNNFDNDDPGSYVRKVIVKNILWPESLLLEFIYKSWLTLFDTR